MTRARRKPGMIQKSVPANTASPEVFAEYGVSGLKRWGGSIYEEYNPQLKGSKWVKVATEMRDNELIVAATLYVLEMMLRQAPWRVELADGVSGKEAEAVRDFVATCFDDLLECGGWAGANTEILSCLTYGWSDLEKVYKIRRGISNLLPEFRSRYNDGKIGWRKFAPRSQDSLYEWEFNDAGSMTAMIQMAAPDYKLRRVPASKLLHFRLRSFKDNPEGYALLRPIYTTYYFAKNIRFFEAVGVERNLAGLPVMEVPPSLLTSSLSGDVATLNACKKLVKGAKVDELMGAVIPAEEIEGKKTGYRFRLLSSAGKMPGDVDTIIKRYESRMAMAMLTQFLLLGQDKVGSYALADSNTELFVQGLGCVLDARDEVFNLHAIPELVRLNGWPEELSPVLVHGDVEKQNIVELAQYITSLVSTGAITADKRLEEHLRDTAGLPKMDSATATVSPAITGAQPADMTPSELDSAGLGAIDAPPELDVSGENIQQQALNGAQVASIVEVLQTVAAGNIPRQSGVELVVTAFPVSREQAERLFGDVGRGFVPSSAQEMAPGVPA